MLWTTSEFHSGAIKRPRFDQAVRLLLELKADCNAQARVVVSWSSAKKRQLAPRVPRSFTTQAILSERSAKGPRLQVYAAVLGRLRRPQTPPALAQFSSLNPLQRCSSTALLKFLPLRQRGLTPLDPFRGRREWQSTFGRWFASQPSSREPTALLCVHQLGKSLSNPTLHRFRCRPHAFGFHGRAGLVTPPSLCPRIYSHQRRLLLRDRRSIAAGPC